MIAFSEKKGCSSCNQPKDEKCGASPAVLQINNPSECMLFHKVEIPASMGNEITIPPKPGLYKNVLLYYEATGNAYFYSSDGVPTLLSYTDYLRLLNKPSINGVTLAGDKSLDDLGITAAIAAAIPASPTVFTMQYTTGSPDSFLPGWQDHSIVEKIGVTNGTPAWGIYKTSLSSSGSGPNYPVTFLNEKTGDVISPEALYNLLLGGEDVVLNHVPLGVKIVGEWADDTAYVDGIRLTKFVESSPYASVGFGGSAFIETFIPIYGENDGITIPCQLGFSISGYTDGDALVYDQMVVRGINVQTE